MWKWIGGVLIIIFAALGFFYFSADQDTRNILANLPTDRDVLFWETPQRDALFRALDRMPILARANIKRHVINKARGLLHGVLCRVCACVSH